MSENVVDMFEKIKSLNKENIEVVPEFDDFYSFLKVMEYLRNKSVSRIVYVELFEDEITIKTRNYTEFDDTGVADRGKCLEAIITTDFEVSDLAAENLIECMGDLEVDL